MRLEKNVGHRWRKGNVPWNKGMSMPEETKLKISKTKEGTVPWNKELIGYRAGRVTPEALKKKISKSCKGRESGMLGKNHSEKTKLKLRKAKLSNNPSAFEAGENHRRWNGGSKAYYGRIAHLVWEEYWRQKVPEGQLIHHFDGNTKNFDETNLVNMPFGFHSKYHRLKEQRV